ncbi:hypothetical protein [Nostoc sp.]
MSDRSYICGVLSNRLSIHVSSSLTLCKNRRSPMALYAIAVV